DGSCSRATAEVFRRSLAEAAARHLPAWAGKLTPHVLRHFCASQLYLAGMSLFAIQELLGHSWTGTTAGTSTSTARTSRTPGPRGSSAPPTGGRDWRDEVDPAAGGRQPWHLEGQRVAAAARRPRPGDQRGEDVGPVVGPAEHGQAGGAGRHLHGARLRRRRAGAARPSSRARTRA